MRRITHQRRPAFSASAGQGSSTSADTDVETHPSTTPLGHNGGPPLEEERQPRTEHELYVTHHWNRAHKAAWKKVPRDIVMFRLARAEAAGVSYREYTLEILERGRYLQKEDVERRGGPRRPLTDDDWP